MQCNAELPIECAGYKSVPNVILIITVVIRIVHVYVYDDNNNYYQTHVKT